ncbi:asparagine synthase-related protein [Pyxidicoccus xibeiensis]|uniref:asparagine synthase-related protein n=1 Tax=Pyxidicoccus xibeiensis TaxID=2906759 RepID=UPI0020A70E6D|nr:asparagine synthase-related protein [Pyxidicoccus xibeiensis]MCP3136644.1 asparagine synthase C-terminal domain-containing protein [Pyxidicoccus xibeiensis]
MSHVPGDASGPLATLPRYQARASEQRVDSVWRLAPEALEPEAVAAFLLHALAPEKSLFREVSRVPVPVPRILREAVGETFSEEALLTALSNTVGQHVATGALDVSLSGGVDSATLCALAARHAPGRIRAWTMDVHFADATERRNARTVARAAGVELVDVPVPDSRLPDMLEAAVLANETALINARAVASFIFYTEARALGASVMLSGAGADEVLLGNPQALVAARARVEEDRRLAREVLRPSAVDNLGTTREPWAPSPDEAGASEEVRHAAWVLRELVLPPELRGAKVHGLTLRTPYLDAAFAHVALALPESVLVRDGVGKWLFRHAVRSLVPDEVRLARKTPRYAQTALSSPVRERWLELYRAWLAPSRLEPLEVIDPGAALALLERYTRLSPDAPEAGGMDRLLMRLVSLAMLHRHCLYRTPCPES